MSQLMHETQAAQGIAPASSSAASASGGVGLVAERLTRQLRAQQRQQEVAVVERGQGKRKPELQMQKAPGKSSNGRMTLHYPADQVFPFHSALGISRK